ncbi:hypothetical protein [Lysobacter tyrosinilyticus]
MKILARALLLLPFALIACNKTPAPATSAAIALPPLRIAALTLPPIASGSQPDLVGDGNGHLLLSWIESQGDGHALKFATFSDSHWTAAQTIATGRDWFINWADTPHLAITPDGALWAHWLQTSARASHAYDVMLVRSADGGRSWSQPVSVNDDDGKAAEHGFVSLWPAGRDTLGIAWLDGREAAADDAADHAHHDAMGNGAMTLRAATFDARLQRHDETRLDAMTCDCCQTDAAMSARGALLVYRDRTPEELRDIAITRQQQGAWTPARAVHADRWIMPACPVNGPAVAAQDNAALVGWYTAAGNMPTLKLARSSDAGDTFAAPVVVDRGESLLGRIDVALGRDAAWVLWLRETAAGQSLQLARYSTDLTGAPQRIEVATLQGRGRGTGMPQLVLSEGTPHVVWTDVVAGKPQLHAAVITR